MAISLCIAGYFICTIISRNVFTVVPLLLSQVNIFVAMSIQFLIDRSLGPFLESDSVLYVGVHSTAMLYHP